MYFLNMQTFIIMEPIQLSALGRSFRVGDLYNYFSDHIMSSGKLFYKSCMCFLIMPSLQTLCYILSNLSSCLFFNVILIPDFFSPFR